MTKTDYSICYLLLGGGKTFLKQLFYDSARTRKCESKPLVSVIFVAE